MLEAVVKIMIVDDEDSIRESFGDYFEDHGLQPLLMESGEAALHALNRLSPDVAIVDIRLKGMSGDEFIRQAYNRQLHCAFIICTGSPAFEIPDTFGVLQRVSSKVFQKPVSGLGLLHQEALRMVAGIQAGKLRNTDE